MESVGHADHEWKVRVRGTPPSGSRAYARNHVFTIGVQASFREWDAHPSAVEVLLGALGGDLIAGWRTVTEKAGVDLIDIEVDLTGRLDNALQHLGVVGESGHCGLSSVRGTVYLGADLDEPQLERLWSEVLARAPVHTTLSRCLEVTIEPRLAP